MDHRAPSCLPALLFMAACGGTGEAAAPSEILGNDFQYQGADGSSPNQGSPEAQSPAQELASEADCKSAATHLVELAYDLEVAQVADPAKQQELRERRAKVLEDETSQRHIQTFTRECLEQGRIKAETDCVTQARSEADVDRCDPSP